MTSSNATSGLLHELRLSAHGGQGPRTPKELDRLLRRSILFWRGLVIADSDLNNNPVFHGQLADGSLLSIALREGFVRRAARITRDGPISQAKVLEGLAKDSPGRAANVPVEHVRRLDELLEVAEQASPPLTWTTDDVASVFGQRLLYELAPSERSTSIRKLCGRRSSAASSATSPWPVTGSAEES